MEIKLIEFLFYLLLVILSLVVPFTLQYWGYKAAKNNGQLNPNKSFLENFFSA